MLTMALELSLEDGHSGELKTGVMRSSSFCQKHVIFVKIYVPFHTFSQCYVRENTVSTVGSPCTGQVDHVQLEKMDS